MCFQGLIQHNAAQYDSLVCSVGLCCFGCKRFWFETWMSCFLCKIYQFGIYEVGTGHPSQDSIGSGLKIKWLGNRDIPNQTSTMPKLHPYSCSASSFPILMMYHPPNVLNNADAHSLCACVCLIFLQSTWTHNYVIQCVQSTHCVSHVNSCTLFTHTLFSWVNSVDRWDWLFPALSLNPGIVKRKQKPWQCLYLRFGGTFGQIERLSESVWGRGEELWAMQT